MTVTAVLIFHGGMDLLLLVPGMRGVLVLVALDAQGPVVSLQRGGSFPMAGLAVPFAKGCVLEGKEELSSVGLMGKMTEGALRRADIQAAVSTLEAGIFPMAFEAYGVDFPRKGGGVEGVADKASPLFDEFVGKGRFLLEHVTLQAERAAVVDNQVRHGRPVQIVALLTNVDGKPFLLVKTLGLFRMAVVAETA